MTQQLEHPPEVAERLIGRDEVAARYGFHPANVAKFVAAGRIPPPVRPFIPHAKPKWLESVINEHLRSLVQQ